MIDHNDMCQEFIHLLYIINPAKGFISGITAVLLFYFIIKSFSCHVFKPVILKTV